MESNWCKEIFDETICLFSSRSVENLYITLVINISNIYRIKYKLAELEEDTLKFIVTELKIS